jgi:hypothetical protein
VDERSRDRVARNETLFRQVNERVRDVSQPFAAVDPSPIDFVCECGREDCTLPVELTLEDYEAVRAVPTHFFVVREHFLPEVERVVREGEQHFVVEKLPDKQQVARDTDPRG